MTSIRTRLASAAMALAAVSLAVAGCSGNSSSSASDGVVLVNGVEPQHPLIPTNTNETGGGRIIDVLYSGLIYYDEDGAAHNDLAQSIDTQDNKVWTMKIRKDAKFSDGKQVKAQNFVKAWNYGANPANAQLGSSFFEPIEGYQAPPEDAGQAPDVPELSGLKVIDDQTFTVTLSEPVADFKDRLGYAVFMPLPDQAFDNMDAYGQAPTVTSGPYQLDGEKGWTHNQEVKLAVNKQYNGPRKAANKGITFKLYSKTDAAYADLQSGQLDVIDTIPDSSIQTFSDELQGRSVSKPVAVWQAFGIKMDAPHFEGEEGRLRRAALSRAINRPELIKKIFHNTKTAAKDFTSPALPNYKEISADLAGSEVLTYDAQAAKDLWAQADQISPWSGKFTIAYNADADHQSWVDAVCHQISNTLGISAEGKPYPDFKSLRDDLTDGNIDSGFHQGWQADYPSALNFIAPAYTRAAIRGGSNDAHYVNDQVEQAVKQASTAGDDASSNQAIRTAQEQLLKDLPAIPLWYSSVTGGWSTAVDHVTFDWHSLPIYYKITKK